MAAAGAFFLVAIVYLLTAVPFLVGADNGEFVTLAVTEGIAHPPGYPLYTAYLRAMSWLPGSSPAHTAALGTAILGAAAVGVLADALRRWGFSAVAAVGAALVFGFDSQVWGVHTHAEVFALNNLIAAAILWAAAPGAPRRGVARAATLGLLAGLGLSNHHTIVLLAPVGLFGLWTAHVEARARWRVVAAALAAGVLGLFPYGYVVASATDCLSCLQWGDPRSLSELWGMFTRADYGTTSLGARGELLPVENLTALARHLVVGTFGVAVVLATVGVASWRRQERPIAQLVVLGATFLLAGPAFALLFNYPPEGIGAEIVARFYSLALLLLAPLVAAGLSFRPSVALTAVTVAAAAVAGATHIVERHTSVIEDYAHDILRPLPPDAIVVGTGDHRMFGVHYQQLAHRVRPDVAYIDASLLAYRWYETRVERRLGVELTSASPSEIPIGQNLAELLGAGRPVFLTHIIHESVGRFPTYPYGVTLRLLSGETPPAPPALAATNAEIFGTFRLQTPPSQVTSAWELEVYDHYHRTWDALASALARPSRRCSRPTPERTRIAERRPQRYFSIVVRMSCWSTRSVT